MLGSLAQSLRLKFLGEYSPNVKPLIPDAGNAQAEWYKRTGLYPINHTIVVKDGQIAYTGKLGADVLRLWVASADYRDDMRLSQEILGHVAMSLVDLEQRDDTGRMHDRRVETVLPGIVQKHAVEHPPHRRLQPEADVAHPEQGVHAGQVVVRQRRLGVQL